MGGKDNTGPAWETSGEFRLFDEISTEVTTQAAQVFPPIPVIEFDLSKTRVSFI